MAGIDITSLFADVLPNPQRQLEERTLQQSDAANQASLVGELGGMAAYLAPQRGRAMAAAGKGLLGIDTRTKADKLKEQLESLGTPSTPQEHKAYADLLDKMRPGSGVQYMMGVAQDNREQQQVDAQTTAASAQLLNAETTASFAERDMTAIEGQLEVEQGKLSLSEITQDDLRDYREITTAQGSRELDIREQEDKTTQRLAELKAGELKTVTLRAINEYSAKAAEQRVLTSSIRNLTNEYIRLEVAGGALGTAKEKWKVFSGNTTEVSALKTKFNQIKNNMVMDSLPPGVASDADIEMAKSGFPTDQWSSESIASYMKGMAKLTALASAEFEARSIFLSENKGDDSGFEKHWREMQQVEGFAEQLAREKGLIWRPQNDAEGNPLPALSGAEGQRRIEEADNAEAEIFERNRRASVDEVSDFVRSVNGQGFRGGNQ